MKNRQNFIYLIICLFLVSAGLAGCNDSGGSSGVKVPNVVGKTQAEAEAAITAAGFTVGTVTQAYHDTVVSGSVIGQTPAADKKASKGSAVALTVSKGPAQAGTVSLNGQVTGSGGLAGVTVAAGGKEATTDGSGFYTLDDVTVPADGRLVLSFNMAGRVPSTRIVDVKNGQTYSVSVSLRSYSQTHPPLNPANAINIETTVGGNQLIGLEIPAGSIQGATGNVNVSTFYGDPTTDDGKDAFPGDYMAAATADDDPDTLLESIVFTEITIIDDDGNEIKDFAEPAKVLLRLPDDLQDVYKAGDTIPWWSFDEEAGIWVREDADPAVDGIQDAEIILGDGGILFAEAYVTHLSWWNCDQPIQNHAVISVYVYDCESNQPLANVQVEARGVTYNGSTYGTTDNTGLASMTVKRSMDQNSPEKVSVWAKTGTLIAPYQVTNTGKTEGIDVSAGVDEIFTPFAEGSTINNSNKANWVTLENKLCLSYDGLITGTVVYAGGSTPVPDFKIWSNVNVSAVTNNLGQYQMKVPKATVTVFAPGVGSQTVSVGDDAVVVNFELANRTPVIDSVTLDPGASVVSGGTVVFAAQATDQDGDAITYAWSASAGTPASGNAASFTWTAPGDNGTAVVTLTITDDKGASTTAQRSVTYGGTIGGENLKVTVKDDTESNQPVADVYVILHGTDNYSVEEFIKTGADGIADFGDVDRTEVTVTFAFDKGENVQFHDARYRLDTIVEMPAGDHVYYMDFDEINSDYEEEWTAESLYLIDASLAWADSIVPSEVNSVMLQPFGYNTYSSNKIDFIDAPVKAADIQSDDKISLLAFGLKSDNSLYKYGFLTDQTITETEVYSVDMDRDPEEVSWTSVVAGTDTDAPVESMMISGMRKGVLMLLAAQSLSPAAPNGLVAVPLDFPVEFYYTGLSRSVSDNEQMVMKRFDGLAEGMPGIPVPDMIFADLSFASGAFSWTKTGTMIPDVINFDMGPGHYYMNGASYEWEASMAGDKTGWTVPQLPDVIAGWIDREELGQAGTWEVNAADFDAISSFDDLLTAFLSGNDPFLMSNVIFMVSLEEEIWQDTAAPLSFTGAQEENQPAVGTESAISGLLRQ